MWILWIITGMSSVLPVSGSMVCGGWQRTHTSTLCGPSAVQVQVIVALVAGRGPDHVARHGHLRAVGHEVEDIGVVVRDSSISNSLRSRAAYTPMLCVESLSKLAGALP